MLLKKLFIRVITGFVAVTMLTAGAFAAEKDTAASSSQAAKNKPADNITTDDWVWQIETAARILKVDDTAVRVCLLSPDNLKINEDDNVKSVQRLKRTEKTIATDSDGGEIDIESIIPGQAVKVRFSYKFVGSDRTATAVECKSVTVQGEQLAAGNRLKISQLKDNTMVATIIEINGNRAKVFIEGGKLIYGSETYSVTGTAEINVKSAVIKDMDGKKVTRNALKKLDRVILSAENNEWRESSPPGYSGGDAIAVRILGEGENVIAPE